MVSVNGVNSDLTVRQVQAEGETAVNKASTGGQGIVYGGEFGEDVQFTATKEPKSLKDFNFRCFTTEKDQKSKKEKKNVSEIEAEARELAREAIQRLQIRVDIHNDNYPNNQISIDYTNFPDPKASFDEFSGNINRAFKDWKDKLTDWEPKETVRLNNKSKRTAEELTNLVLENQQKLANLINAGRYEVYINAGITQARIEQLAQEVNYNFDNLTVMLNKEFQKTRAHTTNVGANVTGQIGKHLDSVYEKLDGKIDDATEEIKGTVQAEGLNTRITVAGVGADVVDKVNQNTNAQGQQTKEIESVSTAISSAIHDWQDVFRADSTIDEVETLKQEIIKSSNIDHNKKMELLNKLLNLVNNDALITDNDLKAIHTETKSIL